MLPGTTSPGARRLRVTTTVRSRRPTCNYSRTAVRGPRFDGVLQKRGGWGPIAAYGELTELGPFRPSNPHALTFLGRMLITRPDHALRYRTIAWRATVACSSSLPASVWVTTPADAMAGSTPTWTSVNKQRIPTTAYGSLLIDPTDSSGPDLFVGTCEGERLYDSEAGLGLYKSH